MSQQSPVERIKRDSRLLRGTLVESLADPLTGAIREDDTALIKFHGTYQQDDRDLRNDRRKHRLEKAYSFMIRIRVPGGVATPRQWIETDRLATQFANGTIKLTTRQAFQFHGIIKTNLKRTIAEINQQGLTIVLIEHNLGEIMRICQRLVVLDNGKKIGDGDPREVMADPAVRVAYLGGDALGASAAQGHETLETQRA